MKKTSYFVVSLLLWAFAPNASAQVVTDQVKVIEGLNGRAAIGTEVLDPNATLTVEGSTTVNGDISASGAISSSSVSASTGTFSNVVALGRSVSTRGSFTVGGSSSSFYPVQFQSDAPGTASSNELHIYRSNVHTNGSWKGTFSIYIQFHPTQYGHFGQNLERIIYQTGNGSPYHDPVGDIKDGSNSGGGRDLIVWLRGGATYEWNNTGPTGPWTLANANTGGSNIVDSSNRTWGAITSQTGIVSNAKNRMYLPDAGIRAKHFVSDTQTYADFVFKPEYKLPELKDVEQFIKANQHLPDIPAEAEVMQNGMDLAAMNVKLLQKVEELTLYIIDQNKRIEALEKKELSKHK
ncbi:hypothetical protein [uncultured Imperialibacter sp.]|uniref:hypothetical protein n=1 Tax=uncultured Imperialibacter sp. TaxID=1672639 RepID=UPI0030D913D0|tara:strand:- start:45016 stop:46065 length:1050 start_codon:yes stop_codon:yes gene_type:complete